MEMTKSQVVPTLCLPTHVSHRAPEKFPRIVTKEDKKSSQDDVGPDHHDKEWMLLQHQEESDLLSASKNEVKGVFCSSDPIQKLIQDRSELRWELMRAWEKIQKLSSETISSTQKNHDLLVIIGTNKEHAIHLLHENDRMKKVLEDFQDKDKEFKDNISWVQQQRLQHGLNFQEHYALKCVRHIQQTWKTKCWTAWRSFVQGIHQRRHLIRIVLKRLFHHKKWICFVRWKQWSLVSFSEMQKQYITVLEVQSRQQKHFMKHIIRAFMHWKKWQVQQVSNKRKKARIAYNQKRLFKTKILQCWYSQHIERRSFRLFCTSCQLSNLRKWFKRWTCGARVLKQGARLLVRLAHILYRRIALNTLCTWRVYVSKLETEQWIQSVSVTNQILEDERSNWFVLRQQAVEEVGVITERYLKQQERLQMVLSEKIALASARGLTYATFAQLKVIWMQLGQKMRLALQFRLQKLFHRVFKCFKLWRNHHQMLHLRRKLSEKYLRLHTKKHCNLVFQAYKKYITILNQHRNHLRRMLRLKTKRSLHTPWIRWKAQVDALFWKQHNQSTENLLNQKLEEANSMWSKKTLRLTDSYNALYRSKVWIQQSHALMFLSRMHTRHVRSDRVEAMHRWKQACQQFRDSKASLSILFQVVYKRNQGRPLAIWRQRVKDLVQFTQSFTRFQAHAQQRLLRRHWIGWRMFQMHHLRKRHQLSTRMHSYIYLVQSQRRETKQRQVLQRMLVKFTLGKKKQTFWSKWQGTTRKQTSMLQCLRRLLRRKYLKAMALFLQKWKLKATNLLHFQTKHRSYVLRLRQWKRGIQEICLAFGRVKRQWIFQRWKFNFRRGQQHFHRQIMQMRIFCASKCKRKVFRDWHVHSLQRQRVMRRLHQMLRVFTLKWKKMVWLSWSELLHASRQLDEKQSELQLRETFTNRFNQKLSESFGRFHRRYFLLTTFLQWKSYCFHQEKQRRALAQMRRSMDFRICLLLWVQWKANVRQRRRRHEWVNRHFHRLKRNGMMYAMQRWVRFNIQSRAQEIKDQLQSQKEFHQRAHLIAVVTKQRHRSMDRMFFTFTLWKKYSRRGQTNHFLASRFRLNRITQFLRQIVKQWRKRAFFVQKMTLWIECHIQRRDYSLLRKVFRTWEVHQHRWRSKCQAFFQRVTSLRMQKVLHAWSHWQSYCRSLDSKELMDQLQRRKQRAMDSLEKFIQRSHGCSQLSPLFSQWKRFHWHHNLCLHYHSIIDVLCTQKATRKCFAIFQYNIQKQLARNRALKKVFTNLWERKMRGGYRCWAIFTWSCRLRQCQQVENCKREGQLRDQKILFDEQFMRMEMESAREALRVHDRVLMMKVLVSWRTSHRYLTAPSLRIQQQKTLQRILTPRIYKDTKTEWSRWKLIDTKLKILSLRAYYLLLPPPPQLVDPSTLTAPREEMNPSFKSRQVNQSCEAFLGTKDAAMSSTPSIVDPSKKAPSPSMLLYSKYMRYQTRMNLVNGLFIIQRFLRWQQWKQLAHAWLALKWERLVQMQSLHVENSVLLAELRRQRRQKVNVTVVSLLLHEMDMLRGFLYTKLHRLKSLQVIWIRWVYHARASKQRDDCVKMILRKDRKLQILRAWLVFLQSTREQARHACQGRALQEL